MNEREKKWMNEEKNMLKCNWQRRKTSIYWDKTSKKWGKKRVKYVHPIGIIKGLTRTPLNDKSTAIT